MSTSMAIAAVTATLQSLISNRVAAEPIASVIGAVNVTTLPPDRIALTGNSDPDQINLFLHQITRNQGWANVDLPSRNSRGERIANPTAHDRPSLPDLSVRVQALLCGTSSRRAHAGAPREPCSEPAHD